MSDPFPTYDEPLYRPLGLSAADWKRVKAARQARRASKDYNVRTNIGKCRYVVSFHDGVKTHADGSPFYDCHIVGNKRDLARFTRDLRRMGYVEA